VLDVLATAYAGLAVSFLVPTAPPWLAGQLHELPFVHRVVQDVISGFDPELYRQGYEIAGTNPVAAMPSLHMAITAVVVITAWRLSRRAGLVATLYGAAMAFSLVYTGEHYALDVVAGVVTAAAATAAVGLAGRLHASTRRPSREGCGRPTSQADPSLEACPPLNTRSGTKPRRASAPV
jgi:membrane-associated phospholipid phosphatase